MRDIQDLLSACVDAHDYGRPRLALSIDISGSMCQTPDEGLAPIDKVDTALNDMFVNAGGAGQFKKVVIPFDHEVRDDAVFEWTDWNLSSQCPDSRHGGTDLRAPVEWVEAHDKAFDLHLLITDMKGPTPGPSDCELVVVCVDDEGSLPVESDPPVIGLRDLMG